MKKLLGIVFALCLVGYVYAGPIVKGGGGGSGAGDMTEAVYDADSDSIIDVTAGGTGAASLTDGGILLGSGTGAITALGVATNGQIPIGDGTTDPVLATIGVGAGIGAITVTNGAGAITLGAHANVEALADGSISGVTFGGFSATDGIAVVSTSSNLSQVFTNLLPDAADGAALGSAAAEWSDLYLADGAIIYGQADQSATLTSSASLWTANNFSVTTQFKLPSSDADNTATAGYMRHDATVTNHAHGAVRWHDGTNVRQVVDMVAATAEGCTNAYVVAYDSTNDLFYCKEDATAGAPTLDTIGDPADNSSITMGDYELTITSASDAWDGVIIENTHADIAAATELLTVKATGADIGAATTLLSLAFTGDATEDGNHVYINGTDYGAGNVFSFTQTQFSNYRPEINYVANAAGGSVDAYTHSQTLGAMDGAGDYVRSFYASLTNANHSNGNIHAFEASIDSLDAETTQIAFKVTGAGFWDYDLSMQNGETIDNATNGQVSISGSVKMNAHTLLYSADDDPDTTAGAFQHDSSDTDASAGGILEWFDGTNTRRLIDGAASAAANYTVVVKTEFIPVGWMRDGAAAPGALTTYETTQYRDFDDAATKDAQFLWMTPLDLIGTTVKVRALALVTNATAPANDEGVSWGISAGAIAASGNVDIARGTEVYSEDTDLDEDCNAQYDVCYFPYVEVTPAVTVAAGTWIAFSVERTHDDADDTYAQDIGLIGIEIKYKARINLVDTW